MRGLGNIALVLAVIVLVLLVLSLGRDLFGGGDIRVQSPIELGDSPDPPAAQPTAPPAAPAPTNPPSQSSNQATTAWTCPGELVENGGCRVVSTTEVPTNACVEYDPRGSDHPVGSYETIDTDQTRQRVLFTQPGQIVLSGGRATIYNNNDCPPFT